MRNAYYASSATPKRLRAQIKSQIEKKNRQIDAFMKICFCSTFCSSLETEIERLKTHPVKVQGFDDGGDHLHDTSGFFFGKKLLLEDLVEELAAFHQFGHQIDML